MDSVERSEVVELDSERSIFLELGRKWPKYVAAWSIRQRSGDSDFPVDAGTVELPPTSQGKEEEIWEELRQRALQTARESVQLSGANSAERPKRSLVDRILGRG
jgi:hypothetical protein